MTILINTPTGNIGNAVSDKLLSAGEPLVVIHRNPAKIASLVERGATVIEGSTDDEAVLDKAFAGVDAVFWVTPPAVRPDYLQWATGLAEKAVTAARKHGVKRAVLLSSVGAQNERVGPVNAVRAAERVFRAGFADLTILRPSYFMENLLRDVPTLRDQGAFYAPVPNDVAMPWVATADIASVAFEELQKGQSGQHIRGIHGPVDLSFDEAASLLSKVLEREIKFVQVPESAARQAMLDAGFPEFAVNMYLELYDGFREGRMRAAEPRTAATTTATSLAEFARTRLRPALLAS